jgi:hypothetical protein
MTLLRVFAVLFFALAAGCGDDATSMTSPPDLNSCARCCHLTGDVCTTSGESCSGFEYSCVCGSDGKWSCHTVVVSVHDMSHSYD